MEQFEERAAGLRKKYIRFAWVRLVSFIGGLAVVLWLADWHWWAGALFFMIFLAAFYRVMRWHQGINELARHNEQLKTVNDLELRALDMDLSAFYEGNEFMDAKHPYSGDLDVFGRHSLFQFLCRAGTSGGRSRLAGYLTAPAAPEEIHARQAAVAELKTRLDWRQNLQALSGTLSDNPANVQLIQAWLGDDYLVLKKPLLKAALWLIPLWSAVALAAWVLYIPWPIYLLTLIPAGLIIRQTMPGVDEIHRRTSHAVDMLQHYGSLIDHLERGQFEAPLLQQMHGYFSEGGYSASQNIRRLGYIISQLNVRMNFFAIFLNVWGLWDLQWVLKLERWKMLHKERLLRWFEAMHEFEALSSLANAWHNRPGWTLPQFCEANEITAVEIGHPLIHPEHCVSNDLSMPSRGHIKLITGSNMAGKSTLLRTVGVNMVLAQAGSAVCAARFSLPRMQVYTSMRTQDALSESTSSFYAELKRLKVIIDAVKAANEPDSQKLPVFFLLDEILKGTNSVDRHTGAAALIRQLIRLQGGGLIATHDLELGKMEAEANGAIENLCMEVEIRNGELFFDYKVRKGVSKSFNATLLMRQMGIDV
ncbi:MAG: hypothetical protein CMN32_06145 [Saprospirales bacterium]|nr:hypothetical protein [Saprospirales bacterium]